ncbi:hypothetical protein B0H19DRAFT_1063287 [Mycena capillaripes]|nr:hypothetical protein B0H19DRAFT_1063287 [Mycena capillaripes]
MPPMPIGTPTTLTYGGLRDGAPLQPLRFCVPAGFFSGRWTVCAAAVCGGEHTDPKERAASEGCNGTRAAARAITPTQQGALRERRERVRENADADALICPAFSRVRMALVDVNQPTDGESPCACSRPLHAGLAAGTGSRHRWVRKARRTYERALRAASGTNGRLVYLPMCARGVLLYTKSRSGRGSWRMEDNGWCPFTSRAGAKHATRRRLECVFAPACQQRPVVDRNRQRERARRRTARTEKNIQPRPMTTSICSGIGAEMRPALPGAFVPGGLPARHKIPQWVYLCQLARRFWQTESHTLDAVVNDELTSVGNTGRHISTSYPKGSGDVVKQSFR